jgi:cytochrome c6
VARAGAEIFHANCASCHDAGGQNVMKEQRTLKKDALNKFIGGYDVDTIQAFLKGSSRHQNQAYF